MNFKYLQMKNTVIILIVLFLFFASCRKKLDVDLPDTEKHIVLNGIINPDSIISIRVTKSQSILDNKKIENLSSATVKLYKNGVFAENLSYSDGGYFYSALKPEINSDYKITADYSGLKSVEAEVKLYNIPVVVSVDTTIRTIINEYGDDFIDTTYEIHYDMTFKDVAETSDYYFISVTQLYPSFEYTDTGYVFSGYIQYSDYLVSTDPVLNKENNEFFLDGMNGRVFNDELFNGNSYTLSFTTYYQSNPGFYINSSKNSYPVYFIIHFLKVSKAIYNYIFSFNLNQNSIDDPFAQPVQVYSNVKNGLGLFSGYSMTTDTIIFDNLKK